MANSFPDGEGLFETLKTIQGRPIFLNEHLDRAKKSAEVLKMTFPDRQDLIERIGQTVSESQVETLAGRLRISFFKDGELSISHDSYKEWKVPARLMESTWEVNSLHRHSTLKTLPYRENLEVLARAQAAGFDEVVRFNIDRNLCEGATSNLLVKINNNWCIPDLTSGCLAGIIRQFVIDNYSVNVRSITESEFRNATSIFLLSSLREIQPVSQIDGRVLYVDDAFLKKVQQDLAQFR